MNADTSPKDTLLVVDDIPDNVRLLLKVLNEAGFKVLVAKDGKAGLEKAQFAKPDLILLDVMMPEMDGFEVCQHLRSDEATQEIPVIFMTALSDTVDKVKGFSLGAVDYITKPFQTAEVLARVTTHLKLRKLQRQLLEELQIRKQYAVELEKRNTELNAFARTVAHDLKSPLNGVIGYSEMILHEFRTELPEEAKDYLRNIVHSGYKMADIIDAILLLARTSQEDTVETQYLEMSSIIHEVINKRLVHLVREFQGHIQLPATWPIALGYAPWIEEVWANYISNGLKYGGQPPQLELGATSQEEGMIRFWVKDNGKGLTPEELAKLFTPFIRLHRKQRNVEGHGLGLSIAQQIIEKLNGQVGVESTLGQGSLFYFTLPAAPPDDLSFLHHETASLDKL